jgi:hypothetical protein
VDKDGYGDGPASPTEEHRPEHDHLPKVVVTSLYIPTLSGDVTHHQLEDNRTLLADRVQEDMIHWFVRRDHPTP